MNSVIKTIKRVSKKYYAIGFYFLSQTAFASSAGGGGGGESMPWDGSLQKMQTILSGTTAHTVTVIAIILGGLGFAVGESGGMMRKAMTIIIGGSIAVGAASIYSTLSIGGALI